METASVGAIDANCEVGGPSNKTTEKRKKSSISKNKDTTLASVGKRNE